jgi:hypothetical protein
MRQEAHLPRIAIKWPNNQSINPSIDLQPKNETVLSTMQATAAAAAAA